MSGNCIGVLSTFQEVLNSPKQPISPPDSTLHCQQKDADLPDHTEPSVDLFLEPERSSCSKEAKSHSDESKSKNEGELQSVNLLSADSGSSSRFVSAAGGLEWLIESLKEKCLTVRCTVPLERLDFLTVTQLCSETTYSSCLGQSSSAHSRQTNEQPVGSGETVDVSESLKPSFRLCLSGTISDIDHLQAGDSFDQAASVTYGRSTNISPLANSKQTAEDSTASSVEQSESGLNVLSTHYTDSSSEVIMDTQLKSNGTVQTMQDENIKAKYRSLTKECSVEVQNLSLSQVQLNGSSKQKEEVLRVSKMQSAEAENEAVLKERCLTGRPIVGIKKVTVPQLKEIVRPRGTTLNPPEDVSDSGNDNLTKTDRQSDGGKGTTASSASMKSRRSTRSEEKTASDKEAVKKRKRMPVAPKGKKRRSTSTDRPRTTRKACVSGMSVSRWKNNGNTSTQVIGAGYIDCSINDMVSSKSKWPKVRTKFHSNTAKYS